MLQWLGVRNAESLPIRPSRLKKQADALSEDWLSRYEAFKREQQPPADRLELDTSGEEPPGFGTKALKVIPNAWKEWVAQSKLLKASDATMVEVLTQNGYSRDAALAEVRAAAIDPYVAGSVRTYERGGMAASILRIQGQLARLNSKATLVERRSELGRNEFRDRYYAANRPVILQDLMNEWGAIQVWTPDYLKSVASDSLLTVAKATAGDPAADGGGDEKNTAPRLAEYIDWVHRGDVADARFAMAEHDLGQISQRLVRDLAAHPAYLNPRTLEEGCSFRLGPPGAVTPLHRGLRNRLIAQVNGRKLCRLVPASNWECLDVADRKAGTVGVVDGGWPNLRRHPKLRHADVIEVVLLPGEALFVPVGWWLNARTLDVSMTMTFTNFLFPNFYRLE